ncbi:MAG TPA: hydantoinase/oxoprolinase N-terminal domain-containing protein, partial [Micromonosporaceae bacterium]
MTRIGADVGGTFTDIVIDTDAQGRVARKVPSTPGEFERAVVDGSLDAVGDSGESITAVVDFRHGTTVATNAVLERNGPATGLLTTEGFRDVLELGRLRTPALYDLAWRKPPALAPRRFRLELAERMLPDGTSVQKPDLDALRDHVERLIASGIRTIAVSLINAYANPAHEEFVADWIRTEYPDVHVTVATNVVRELGEYERTSTAVLNAYLQPVVAG